MPSGRTRYGRIALVERNADEEEESSEEEDEDAMDPSSDEANDDTRPQPTNERAVQQTAKQGKIHVSLGKSSELLCHVCGQKGHKAGFVGATYMDCPNKPCYLCKEVGHTTATCPHRAMPGAAAAASPAIAGRTTSHLLMQREQSGIQQRSTPLAAPYCPNWQVEAAILKLHTRRVCCLEYPGNSDRHVISGDKKGGIAIWNFTQVHDRTHYPGIHRALVNTVKWCSWLTGGFNCFSASSDGTARISDIETGVYQTLADINPNGWHQGCKWNMFYGAAENRELGALLAGDSDGKLYLFDPRVGSSSSNGSSSIVSSLQVHKAGSKVNSISVNPAGGSNCVLTAGGDHTVKLFDLRKLTSVKPPPAISSSSSAAATPTPAAPTPAAAAAAEEGGSSRGRGRGSGRGGRKRSAAAAAAVSTGHNDENEDPAAAAAAAAGGSGRGRGRGRSTRGRGNSSSTAASAAAAASSSATPTKQSIRSAMAAAMAAAATAELAVMPHGRVVNHAVFSPSGRKILTTCQDNRLRIWDNVLMCQSAPTREIVHSHDFNRYLTPFKAEWFHNDPSESRIICGRYISEDFGGIALHPIDIFDANTGGLLQQLTDLNLTTITPVNKPHPRLDIIISGSSRSLYKWTPQSDDDESDPLQTATSGRVSAAAADLVRRSAAAAAAVRSSSNFMCFDADPNGSGAKKRGGTSGTAGAKSVTKQKTLGAKSMTKGRGGSNTATTAAGRGRKRGRGAAASDDEEGESDDSDD